ncbi:hypothetical protein [Kibdelosporangium phytohabitans]|uniref:Uncharacterized protein n=1 Tax=Kibdelosporangium phytohabitans TaxID=860235 RepID=A0A0N9HUQ9_9PSEU|nr:hypothetical protein [Kibdelosporangium phytohabitans]ALG08753.1 hypothetical protein AOZ06_19155 [Kibdelosporangium phytohabitans]MBE1470129.1 tetratricopeptide (TPR) repeat protein [Kibdelosporangium phytohabitans]
MADGERLPRKVDARRTGAAEAASGGYANSGVHIGSIYSYPRARSRYREQVRQIAPPELIGRDSELADLASFCAGSESYAWWRATKWAGKSALMAWFVLHPPPDVRVVSFFVTGRLAGQDHRGAFVDVVLEQLAELLGEPLPTFLPEVTREHHLVGMLAEAAQLCRHDGKHLVLVVDGLDEDRGTAQSHSIAALLPVKPPDGMKVIVAGRPNPPVPQDVDRDHPLRDPTIVRPLTTSPAARVIRDDMELELDRLLTGSQAEQDLLGVLTVAAGGLSGADLAELTGSTPSAVRRTLRRVAARSFDTRPGTWRGPEVYLLGHEELQATAVEEFGAARLETYRGRLHAWADGYRARGWPEDSPEYLLRGYFRMLVAQEDLARMAGCATDAARQDRLLDLSGGDLDAIAELTACQEAVLARPDVDLPVMARLAIHRDRLIERNDNIPRHLPALWARLGQRSRAEALLRMITDLAEHGPAAVSLVQALAESGDAAAAEAVAASITTIDHRAEARIAMIKPLVRQGDPAAARTIAQLMPSTGWQVEAVVELAEALVDTDSAQAGVLIDAAEQLAKGIEEPYLYAGALIRVAGGVVTTGDSDRAERLLQTIVDLNRGIYGRVRMVGAALARQQFDNALRWAKQISSKDEEAQMLAAVAHAVAKSGDLDRARELAVESHWAVGEAGTDRHEPAAAGIGAMVAARDMGKARQWLAAVPDGDHKDTVLVSAATAAAETGELDYAAEAISAITGTRARSEALVVLAEAHLAAGNPEQARESAVRAERTTRSVVSVQQWTWAALEVVRTAERMGNLRRAHELALATVARALPVAHQWAAEPTTTLARCLARLGEVDRATELIAAMPDPEDQVAAVLRLGKPRLVHARLDWLADRIEAITGTHGRDKAWASAARVLAGQPDTALAIATTVADDNRRMETFLALLDPDDPERVLEHVTHAYWYSEALVRLAARPDLIGRFAVEPIPQVEWRFRVLLSYAKSLLRHGENQRARDYLDQAQACANQMPSPYGQARALLKLADLMNTPRYAAEAQELLRRAEAAATYVPHPGRRADMTGAVVKSLAARGDFTRAEQLATTIGRPGRRAEVLAALVKTLIAAGEIDRAQALAVTIEHSGRQAEAVLAVVKSHPDAATAVALAERIPNRDYQAEAYAWLVARAGQWELADRIRTMLPEVSSRNTRSRAIRDVAGALARSGGVERAGRFASSIADPADQATAWQALAGHLPGRAVARILHLRHWSEALDVVDHAVLDVITAEVFAEQRGSAPARAP